MRHGTALSRAAGKRGKPKQRQPGAFREKKEINLGMERGKDRVRRELLSFSSVNVRVTIKRRRRAPGRGTKKKKSKREAVDNRSRIACPKKTPNRTQLPHAKGERSKKEKRETP